MRPRPSLRKWGNKKLISKYAIGYSLGKWSSFQNFCAGGVSKNLGLNLFQALGEVPPTVPTLPVSTFRKCRQRDTAHPPRLPEAALRQLWVEKRVPARPI